MPRSSHRRPGLLDASLLDVAPVSLGAWQQRDTQKPYMFGHGKTFKTNKWPPAWYRVYAVLDTLGRYPGLWHGEDARPEDRRSLAELIAASPPCPAPRAAPALSYHHPRRVTKGPRSPGRSSETERAPLAGDLVGGAEGTRTPDPLVANCPHRGHPGLFEQRSVRSKAREPGGGRWRCCTQLLYFSALRIDERRHDSPNLGSLRRTELS